MVRDILLVQKRELEARLQEPYIRRDAVTPLNLQDGLVKVITGPRRAGKSFYAIHLFEEARPYGYINFDDERLIGLADYDEILTAAVSVYGQPRILILDEVQNLPRWEIFVNRLQRQGWRLIITGSNANLLSSELSTHLTGRHTPIVLFPFSFREYLRASGGEQTSTEKMESLMGYAEEGGYPEPLVKGIDRSRYLRTLLQSTLYKDIVRRFKIRGVQGMEDLALYLMSNMAREYSFNVLSQVTQCRSVRTVEKYMGYLKEAYLIFDLKRFSFRVKDQVSHAKKIYCIDNGMAVTAGFGFSPDRGSLFENLVAIALKHEEIAGKISLYYWKNAQKEEVDFVVKKGPAVSTLIQVCVEVSNPKTLKREMRALLQASEELRCDDLLLLNDRVEGIETIRWHGIEKQVRLMPLWQWLEAGAIS